MNTEKMLHLQLVILHLIDTKAADITHDEVAAAVVAGAVVPLLRDRYSTDGLFRGKDTCFDFSTLGAELSESLSVIMPEFTAYELYHSGLCLVAAAITHAMLKPQLR